MPLFELTEEQVKNPDIPLGWRRLEIGEITRAGDYWWGEWSKIWRPELNIYRINRLSLTTVIRYYGVVNQVTIE